MELETTRLILRDFTIDDIENLFLLDNDAVVMKYLGRPPVIDKNDVRSRIKKKMHYNKNNPGLGFCTVTEKKNNSFVGQFSLSHIEFDKEKEIEIGFRFLQRFWGLGYATEMAHEVIKHGFKNSGLDKIVALTHPDNLASQKVIEKIGLKYIRDDFYYNTNLRFYEITRKNSFAAR